MVGSVPGKANLAGHPCYSLAAAGTGGVLGIAGITGPVHGLAGPAWGQGDLETGGSQCRLRTGDDGAVVADGAACNVLG